MNAPRQALPADINVGETLAQYHERKYAAAVTRLQQLAGATHRATIHVDGSFVHVEWVGPYPEGRVSIPVFVPVVQP